LSQLYETRKLQAKLTQYKADHGHCLVPQRYKEIKGLGKWVAKHCEYYKKAQKSGECSPLMADRLKKLESVGFACKLRVVQAVVTHEWNSTCKL